MAILDRDDPVLARLRSLPPHVPDGAADALVLEAARAALAGGAPPNWGDGWLARTVVPALLSVTTIGYLWWAIHAAGAMYL